MSLGGRPTLGDFTARSAITFSVCSDGGLGYAKPVFVEYGPYPRCGYFGVEKRGVEFVSILVGEFGVFFSESALR